MQHDPFEMFGLPRRYAIDPALLAERHRALARELHPDRHASAGDAQRRLAMSMTASLNDAHRLLRDPVGRAQTLLTLHGVEQTQGHTVNDPELLTEQIDLHEAMDDARSNGAALRALADDLARRIHAVQDGLGSALDAVPPQLDDATALTRRLQFLLRLREELDNRLFDLDSLPA